MTSMLLFLSMLLHLITLTAIFQLFKQLQSLKQNHTGEMAELMEAYLEDIKEENRLLKDAIPQKDLSPETAAAQKASDSQLETNIKNENGYSPETAHVADESELSLEAQILQLHDKGITVDEIARQLNCGKTEAELIIKMKKKAHHNA
ncbi:hypothetical protein SAMN04488072_101504 [Lentibacillus halodurans]|uniref:Coupling factor for flagellin transcription and translation n=1 Tax=Lentibacillus halodurans TaxID=237679 RepID=A0A1I0VLU3_9BACI|nr:hypothetical protein [Lentibacillus halodurans]SFA77188.1 hypothetical protein SAMN04488072_101504 [Lentibacillus halodurans]